MRHNVLNNEYKSLFKMIYPEIKAVINFKQGVSRGFTLFQLLYFYNYIF